jgi:hypothetical protein
MAAAAKTGGQISFSFILSWPKYTYTVHRDNLHFVNFKKETLHFQLVVSFSRSNVGVFIRNLYLNGLLPVERPA